MRRLPWSALGGLQGSFIANGHTIGNKSNAENCPSLAIYRPQGVIQSVLELGQHRSLSSLQESILIDLVSDGSWVPHPFTNGHNVQLASVALVPGHA